PRRVLVAPDLPLRANRTGSDRISADAMLDVLRCERFREGNNAALRRCVSGLDRTHQAEMRSDIDDRAAARSHEVRDAMEARQEKRQEVEGDRAVPNVEIHFVHGYILLQRAARAIHDYVEPAEPRH